MTPRTTAGRDSVATVIFATDPHVSFGSHPTHKRWFPSLIRLFPARARAWLLGRLDWRSQANFAWVLEKAHQISADAVICGGDATPGEDEMGMLSSAAEETYRRFRALVERHWRGDFRSVWGNHDVGYHYLRSRMGGITFESIENAERLIGPPYQRVDFGGWALLLITSELPYAAANSSHAPRHFREYLRRRSLEQEEWLRSELRRAERVILVDHDPRNFLRHIWPVVIDEGQASKIHLTLAGHVHLRVIGQLLKLVSRSARQAHLEVVPSTWQAWGIGCGFAVLELENDRVGFRVESIPRARVPRRPATQASGSRILTQDSL